MDLKHYYCLLESHDWFFDFSDDPTVYRKGKENYNFLQKISHESGNHLGLLDEWESWADGVVLGKNPIKPKRPE